MERVGDQIDHEDQHRGDAGGEAEAQDKAPIAGAVAAPGDRNQAPILEPAHLGQTLDQGQAGEERHAEHQQPGRNSPSTSR